MKNLSRLGLVALLALGVGLLPTDAAVAAGCEAKWGTDSASSTCKGELGWSYNPAARTFGYGSAIASATVDDPYEYIQDYACDANATNPAPTSAAPEHSTAQPDSTPTANPCPPSGSWPHAGSQPTPPTHGWPPTPASANTQDAPSR